MNKKIMKIKLSRYGEKLAPRVLGRSIKVDVLNQLDCDSRTILLFDLSEVETMSTGFAKELFGELQCELPGRFTDRVKFRFGSNKQLLMSTIARGLRGSMRKSYTD